MSDLKDDILIAINRATTPQSGWHIYQKIKNNKKTDGSRKYRKLTGSDCCEALKSMAVGGHVHIVGSDADCGCLYGVKRA